MTAASDNEFSDPTPEEINAHDQQMAEMEATIHDLKEQGWIWSEEDSIKRVLMHPDDREINIWFDPYTAEPLLSPKLAERLIEDVRREKHNEP